MKRAWQLGPLAVLALLMVQPAMAAFACAPLVGANVACATCPSSMGQPGECPQLLTAEVQGQHSCCQLDVPDSTLQVLVDRFSRDHGIGHVVIERPLPRVALPTLRGLESDHSRTLPLPAASLQSLYCTFLI
jgi:hypothetical protein